MSAILHTSTIGQVVYYGLLQLFLTPRAVYLLVFDAEKGSKMEWGTETPSNLETLAVAPWLRHLTFRVPGANVVLVGNKWDLVASKHSLASEVEHQSRSWLDSWIEKVHGHRSHGLTLEDGVSLVSCAPPLVPLFAPPFDVRTGWPCDKSKPGLFRRITHNVAGNARALTMHLPLSYRLALELLEELASSSRYGRRYHEGVFQPHVEQGTCPILSQNMPKTHPVRNTFSCFFPRRAMTRIAPCRVLVYVVHLC